MLFKTLRLLCLLAVVFFVACSGMKPTVFVNKQYNFNFLEKVAVVPFENLSTDQGAGARITHIFLTEMLAAESFDIAEPGEVSKVTQKYIGSGGSALTRDQIKEIVRLQIAIVQKQVSNQLTLELTEKAVTWIADKGYDPQFGARPVKRLIQKEILNELSKEILAGTIQADVPLIIDADEQGLKFRNE